MMNCENGRNVKNSVHIKLKTFSIFLFSFQIMAKYKSELDSQLIEHENDKVLYYTLYDCVMLCEVM